LAHHAGLSKGEGVIMRVLFLGVLLASLVLETHEARATEHADQFFSVLHNPAFSNPEASLERLIARRGTRPKDHVCVVGYRAALPSGERAWVYWAEARALVLWEPMVAEARPGDALLFSRRTLSLDRDVVPTEADLHGSTYRVTKAWVDSVLSDCRTHGERFVIPMRAAR
jgi:hypothetical protein